jgi:uncharacterized protein YdcH (DUF465 family)
MYNIHPTANHRMNLYNESENYEREVQEYEVGQEISYDHLLQNMKKQRFSTNTDIKKSKTIEALRKDQERRSRDPSIRLGKHEKKMSARRENILKQEGTEEETDEEEEVLEKPRHVTLCRLKRKPGHRETRPEQPNFDFDENENEFPVISHQLSETVI